MKVQISQLVPFWQRHLILLRVCAVLCVLLSPILAPLIVLINNFDDVVDCVRDVWSFMLAEFVDDREDK
jgi:hypothetical protein